MCQRIIKQSRLSSILECGHGYVFMYKGIKHALKYRIDPILRRTVGIVAQNCKHGLSYAFCIYCFIEKLWVLQREMYKGPTVRNAIQSHWGCDSVWDGTFMVWTEVSVRGPKSHKRPSVTKRGIMWSIWLMIRNARLRCGLCATKSEWYNRLALQPNGSKLRNS